MVKDWTKIQKKYAGLWVAFADDEKTVVGSGKSLKDAMKSAQEKGYDDPIFNRMPEEIVTFVGLP